MGSIIVRNVPDEVHRALKQRAGNAGRSTEAEIRLILEGVARPSGRVLLGDVLTAMREKHGAVDLDDVRDDTPEQPVDFS